MQSYSYGDAKPQHEEQPSSEASAQEQVRTKKSKKAASAFKTISEVADLLNVQQHVLRFWETKFSQVRPLKRGGGRRYYRPEDVELLQSIHHLLYTEGYTIKGVQKLLKEQGKNKVVQNNKSEQQAQKTTQSSNASVKPQISQSVDSGSVMSAQNREMLKDALGDLKAMKALIAK